ncbi:MAG: glycosyltransferase family 2 protein [Bdellovibrionia bacterium]
MAGKAYRSTAALSETHDTSQSAGALAQASSASARRLRLMVVVPAYNEAKNIPTVVSELRSLKLPGIDVSFVLIDDGSKDQTYQVARELGASIIRLPYNMGIGMAVQTGFKYALRNHADFVVQVDGDCQHIPTEIEKLLVPSRQEGSDVVIGSRFKESASEGIESTTFLRWFVGRALSLNIRILTGMQVSDTTSGFRLFNKRAAQFVAESYPDDYPEVQILVPLACHGFRVSEVPVKMRPRKSGTSSINWHRSIYYVFKVVLSTLFDRVRGRGYHPAPVKGEEGV